MFLPGERSYVLATVLTDWQPVEPRKPLKLGHQAGREEQNKALLCDGWAFMGTVGFLGQVPTETTKTPD